MRLVVISEEVMAKWPMWAVSVSMPPTVRAMFEDESEAKDYAAKRVSKYTNVRVLMVRAEP